MATAVQIEKTPIVKKPSRPQLPGIDSVKFFLISYITIGHFIGMTEIAKQNRVLLLFTTQINVVVGAFFVITGYLAGYTTTEVGKLSANEARLQPASSFIIGRIMGYYHLHAFVLLLFLPMFAFVDWTYSGAQTAIINGLMSFTLIQSWFPDHAEVWNPPMWFLSAMTFATFAMPSAIIAIAKQNKNGLRQSMAVLTGGLLLARLAYSYDLDCWQIMEGVTPAKKHPSQLYWNIIRFNPAYALAEMLMGVVAVRFVMLDGTDGEETPSANGLMSSPLVPLLGMIGILVLRAYEVVLLNDPLTRSIIFIPLFIKFLINLHRQTIYGEGSGRLSEILAISQLQYLGKISFPIFVIHGPLGQVFYKKLVRNKLFAQYDITGWPDWFFLVYLGLVVLASMILEHGFLQQKVVQDAMKTLTNSLKSKFT